MRTLNAPRGNDGEEREAALASRSGDRALAIVRDRVLSLVLT